MSLLPYFLEKLEGKFAHIDWTEALTYAGVSGHDDPEPDQFMYSIED